MPTLTAAYAPDPAPETVSYTVKGIPEDLWRKVRHLAIERDSSLRDLLLDLMREAVAADTLYGGPP